MTANKFLGRILFVIFAFSMPIFAQDGEPVVIDEVIAQVNDGVITLSRVKREMKTASIALAQQQRKTPEVVLRDIEAKRPEFIAGLINEELLIQQGKEMGLEEEVEKAVNEEFLGIMKQYNFKTLEELYNAMRTQGEDPEDVRTAKRKDYMKFFVIRYGVQSKIYNGLGEKELRAYYETNKDKFKKPEVVKLSEIFLNFAGRTEPEVKAEAADIIKKARAGENFIELCNRFSDRADSKANKCSLGEVEIGQINNKEISDSLKTLKVGAISEPFVQEDGVLILRMDERSAATGATAFDERRVREAITAERTPTERKKYMATLRGDAYIKIAESYKTEVSQALAKEDGKN